jgi:hypothetical protein
MEGRGHEGVINSMSDNKCTWFPPLRNPQGVYLYVWLGGLVIMSEPPLPHLRGVCSHRGIIVISYSQLLYTEPISWWHMSLPVRPPFPSSSHLFNDGLHPHEPWGPLLGSCAHRPISNHEMRRFIHESMCVEANHAWWCQGAFDSQHLAYMLSNPVELNACSDAGRGGASMWGLWPMCPTVALRRRGSGNQTQWPILGLILWRSPKASPSRIGVGWVNLELPETDLSCRSTFWFCQCAFAGLPSARWDS